MIRIPDALSASGLSVLDHAVALTEVGWKGVAIYGMRGSDCACGKGHNDSPSSRGKHPIELGWQRNPLVDSTEVRNVLIRYSYPINLGIVLGLQTPGDYVIAVDVDDAERYAALEAAYGVLPDTAACASGRGVRLFFTLPADAPRDRVKNITGLRAPGDTAAVSGVDVKAAGGQVVVAPSTHWTGATYAWTKTGAVAELPVEWVLAILSPAVPPPRYTPQTLSQSGRARSGLARWFSAAVTSQAGLLSRTKAGQRNSLLNESAFSLYAAWQGAQLLGGQITDGPAFIAGELTKAAAATGLSAREIERTLQSALRGAETANVVRFPQERARPPTNGVNGVNGTNGTAPGAAYAPVVNGTLAVAPEAPPAAPESVSGVYAILPPAIPLIMNNDTGKPEGCASNAARLFSEHPDWQGGPVLDRFIGRITWPTPIPMPIRRIVRDSTDLMEADVTAAQGWLLSLARSMRVKLEVTSVRRGIQQAASWRGFDSLQQRVLQLPAWDGKERLSAWLITYAGVADTPVTRLFGRRWMISTIARAMVPGCIADGVLVLEGEQGIGKNRLVTSIFGDSPWVHSIGSYRIGQDVEADRIAGHCWVVHDDEMRSRKSEVDALKGWISRREDVYRVPYEIDINPHKRRAVLICSTNRRVYLEDEANRRFWPVRCGVFINWASAERDSPQLLAEALAAYRAGEPWTISPNDPLWSEIQESQDRRRSVDPLVNEVRTALTQLTSEFSIAELYKKMEIMNLKLDPLDRRTEMRLGMILRDMKFTRNRLRVEGARTYVYTRRDGEDKAGPDEF